MFLETAREAALEGGVILKEHFWEQNPVKFKNDGGSLTKLDKLSEEKILSILREHFPDHTIISEEAGTIKGRSQYTWYVDPLDGTSNYAAQIPIFSVSIGLVDQEGISIGVIYDPIHDKLYTAERWKGSFVQDSKSLVSETKDLASCIVSFGRAPSGKERFVKLIEKLEVASRTPRVLGSVAINMCYVANGHLDAAVLIGAKPWDIAAGILIVEEAGGKVTTFEGEKASPDTPDILVTNGHVHEQILQILNS
jgi:myo-inositol-1(or 4)-monophosphatase